MTRSPKNSSDGSTSSTPRSTTEPSAGPKTQTTTCPTDETPSTQIIDLFEALKKALEKKR